MERLNAGCGNDIREAYENVDLRDVDGVDTQADIRDLPFENERFDFVLAQDVLEHFWDYESVLQELKRVMKGDGVLCVRVPDWNALADESIGGEFDFANLEKAIYGGHKNPHDVHHRLFTKRFLKERLLRQGFKDVKVVECREKPVHWHLVGAASKSEMDIGEAGKAIEEATNQRSDTK